jgi:hypothetical protein
MSKNIDPRRNIKVNFLKESHYQNKKVIYGIILM